MVHHLLSNTPKTLAFNAHYPFNEKAEIAHSIVKKIANNAQIRQNVIPHVLRHTFATTALQKGLLSLAAVQKILEHDRLTTTAIYLNLTDTHVIEEFQRKW